MSVQRTTIGNYCWENFVNGRTIYFKNIELDWDDSPCECGQCCEGWSPTIPHMTRLISMIKENPQADTFSFDHVRRQWEIVE